MINLLPPEIKNEIRYGQLNILAVQYAVLIILVSLSLVAVLFFGVSVVSGDERSLKQAIEEKQVVLSELDTTVAEAKELEQTIDTISALLKRELSFAALLKDIGAVVPSGASLTGLSLTGDESLPLSIDAVLSEQSTAAIMRENLENSDLFQNADIQSITASEIDEAGVVKQYQARFVVNFQPAEDER